MREPIRRSGAGRGIVCGSGGLVVALGHDDGDQEITPVAVATVMAGGANEFDRNAGIDGLHDRMVETVQVIGQHADHRLLIGAHGQ